MRLRRHLANRAATALRRIAGGESAAALLLMLAIGAAMMLANSTWAGPWRGLFLHRLAWTPIDRLANWHSWISEGLMAIFFFAVGLEIKREVLDGELSTPARRALPLLAAVVGMVLPALVYLLVSRGETALRPGWAIPAATDIAFALGVLGLLGKRVPPGLRLLLLTIAIADDLGAVAIIALFYTKGIAAMWLAAALAVLLAMVGMNWLREERGWTYMLLALALWYCTLHSGVHATVAGVAAALTIPLRLDAMGDSPLLRMEHALAPWVGYLIVPLFGLANAGVNMSQAGAWGLLAPLPLAVGAGLLVGKQAGIFGTIFAAEKLGLARRPLGTSWTHIWGLALLCGIGFTMSLFIGGLAFPHSAGLIEQAKLGVLAGSLVSALLGYGVLRLSGRE
jgi:Na+:H+ antiporter, NhaA family